MNIKDFLSSNTNYQKPVNYEKPINYQKPVKSQKFVKSQEPVKDLSVHKIGVKIFIGTVLSMGVGGKKAIGGARKFLKYAYKSIKNPQQFMKDGNILIKESKTKAKEFRKTVVESVKNNYTKIKSSKVFKNNSGIIKDNKYYNKLLNLSKKYELIDPALFSTMLGGPGLLAAIMEIKIEDNSPITIEESKKEEKEIKSNTENLISQVLGEETLENYKEIKTQLQETLEPVMKEVMNVCEAFNEVLKEEGFLGKSGISMTATHIMAQFFTTVPGVKALSALKELVELGKVTGKLSQPNIQKAVLNIVGNVMIYTGVSKLTEDPKKVDSNFHELMHEKETESKLTGNFFNEEPTNEQIKNDIRTNSKSTEDLIINGVTTTVSKFAATVATNYFVQKTIEGFVKRGTKELLKGIKKVFNPSQETEIKEEPKIKEESNVISSNDKK